MTSEYVPSGANVTYSWSYSGWSGSSGNNSTITLTPNSGTVLPSSVSVTPSINGVAQATKTCTVGRAPFTTTAVVTGNSSLCSATTYSVNNLPSGVSVTAWSVSNNTIASIVPNGNQATLAPVGNGTVTVTATLTNSCGQTKQISKNVYVGKPDFPPYPAMNGDNNPLTGEYKTYSVTGADGATSYNWYFDVGNGVKGTNVGGWQILSYGYQDKSIYAKVGNPGSTVVVCEATNSCGERMKYLFVNVRGELEPCGGLRLSANPMKSGDPGNHVIYPPIDPCDDPYGRETEDSKKTIEIFDQYGVRVLIKSQVGNEFDLSHLKSGFYIIKSKSKSKSISGKTMTEKLIVE